MSQERSSTEPEANNERVEVSVIRGFDNKGIMKKLLKLSSENKELINEVLEGRGDAPIGDITEVPQYFKNVDVVVRGRLSHLIDELMYSVDAKKRKEIATEIADSIASVDLSTV
ncbi:MAG: hypothetical protein WC444_00115 [Candidatus Paceibacterota bacterium]